MAAQVNDVTYQGYTLLEPPERFEVGVQNYPGQIAARAAVHYIQKIGLNNINEHLYLLNRYLTEQLLARYGGTGWFRIIGPTDARAREVAY